MADLEDQIEANASGPKRASGDQGSMEQHSLPDQIAADKYLANKQAKNNKTLGLRRIRIEMPGGV